MSYSGYPQSYEIYKASIPYQQASQISSVALRQACLNNDFLLKRYGITFAKQLRDLASNGVILNRRYYELMRQGKETGPKHIWISYLVWYWNFLQDCKFNVAEFQLESFQTSLA